jgi:hypothetical protein
MRRRSETGPSSATPSELEAYSELLGSSLLLRDEAFIHQHVVDAWIAQHADERTRPIGLTFALVGLYLHIERGFSGRLVQRAHMALGRRKRNWPGFTLPAERGPITAVDVMAAPPGPDRNLAIDTWASSAWDAFRGSHRAVADLVNQHEIGQWRSDGKVPRAARR